VILRSSIRSAEVHRDTRCAPTWRELSGFSTAGSKFVLIVRRARMVSIGDNGI
jgi:hypothetical protein